MSPPKAIKSLDATDTARGKLRGMQVRQVIQWMGAEDEREDEQRDTLDRLASSDISTDDHWILKHTTIATWIERGPDCLVIWLNAFPGSGKSVACSKIIQHIQHHPEMMVIYYFCSYSQSSRGQEVEVLRSLTRQLFIANAKLAPYFLKNFVDKGLTPTKKCLRSIFQFLVTSTPFVRIIIDGLDEVPQSEQEEIIGEVLRIKGSDSGACKVLFASRRSIPISQMLQDKASINLGESFEHINNQISSFIRSRLSPLCLAPHFSDEIEHRVVTGAQGSFLWAKLLMLDLEKCSTEQDIRKAIETVPLSLEEMYKANFARICGIGASPNQRSAMKLLQVLLAAGRPLKWSEAQTAIATISEARNGPEVLRLCFPILEVRGSGDKFVDFFHFTARECLRFHYSFIDQKTSMDENKLVLDDGASVQSSNMSSIFSTSEGASFESQSSAGDIMSAMDEMVNLLANDEVLKPLYHAAIEIKAIGGDRFGRHFRRLLKLCSEELKKEAHDNLQLYVVKLLRSRGVYLSNIIRAMYDPVYENRARGMRRLDAQRSKRSGPDILEQYLQDRADTAPKYEPQQLADDIPPEVEQDDGASQSSNQESEPDQDQMDHPNLTNLKKFFLSSSAFANLRTNFQQFVRHYGTSRTSSEVVQTLHPAQPSSPNLINAEGKQAASPLSHKRVTNMKTLQALIFDMLTKIPSLLSDCALAMLNSYNECFEPVVDRDKVRIRWKCPCGKMLWDDFRELRPGAAEDLRRSLDFPKRTMSAQEACSSPQISNAYTIGTNAGSVSTRTVSSDIGTPSSFSTAAAADGAVMSGSLSSKLQNEPKYLLLCFKKPRDTLRLYQLSVNDITTDFQLFRLLRDTYKTYQGLSGRFLKARKIRSVLFRKLERHPRERVVIRSCPNIVPCRINPDVCHKDHAPKCDTEYDLDPVPADLDPYIGPNGLEHLLNHPHEAEEEGNNLPVQNVWLKRFPKKEKSKLSVCPPFQYGLGWGVEFEEVWNFNWLLKSTLLCCVLGATVFLVCWWSIRGDIQGATGMAALLISYGVLLITLFTAFAIA